MKRILLASVMISWLFLGIFETSADEVFFDPKLLPYDGKSYGGPQDPNYIDYDSALRDYMVKRIKQKFGVALDPKKYSGFDLLEIESFFECKKSEEPYDLFLKMFPRQR
jgi:hypothetical protein